MKPDGKLLLITTSYLRAGDGSDAAGVFVADLADELSRRMRVAVVAPGAGEGHSVREGIELHTFRAPDGALSLLSPANPKHWPQMANTLGSLKRATLQANRDGRVRHALALWVLPCGWAARCLQRSHGVPYSVWALGSDIWSLGRLPLVRNVLKRVASDAQHAFADGIGLAQDAARIAGRPFAFLPSTRRLAAARERPIASRPPFRLLFLGRWHANKGTDLLMQALALLDEQDWARIAEVHIAGGGPLAAAVESGVAGLRTAGRPVRLSGYLDSQQAAQALAAADRLLLPSRVESIPVVYSDAMKFSLPVVAMPVGDLPTLIGAGTGWLAQRVDAAAFASAIRDCLDQTADAAAIDAMNERFSVESIASDIVTAIAERTDRA